MAARTSRIGLLLLLLLVSAPASQAGGSASDRELARAARGLHVVGNRLVDGKGRTVRLHGINRSGTEYACVQGWGIFDGPSNSASVKAIASWHVNIVRVPLNAHCWLGINGVKRAYSGAGYRRAIVTYVKLLHRHGLYAELSLMWSAPGSYQATYQPGGPDADHAPKFWASLASTFKRDRNVILAPWGETIVNARCFLRGGVCEATFGPNNKPYRIAGMQQAVTVMRAAGYRGVIAIPGLDYANDLSKWLSHKPRDPLGQLIAEAHVYGNNTCSSRACLDRTMAPVARRVPLIFGETGETHDASSCQPTHISRLMRWADERRAGYLAWTWNTWGNCSALIRDWSGRPYSRYATWVRSHFAATRKVAPRLARTPSGA